MSNTRERSAYDLWRSGVNNSLAFRGWPVRLLGPAVFLIVLLTSDLSSVGEVLSKANVVYLLGSLPLTWLIVAVRSFRWHLLNKHQNIDLRFWKEFRLYAMAFTLGIVTPGRIGELSKAYYLAKMGHASERAVASVLVDRLWDVIWVAATGGFGFLVYFGTQKALWPMFAYLVVVLTAVGSGFLVGRRFLSSVYSREHRVLRWAGTAARQFGAWVDRLWAATMSCWGAVLIPAGILTGLSWIIQYAQGVLFAHALGIPLGFVQVALMISTVGLVSMLPVSVGGIGSRDLTLVILFGQVGLGRSEALSFSLCILMAVIFYVMGGLLVLMWKSDEISLTSGMDNQIPS